MKKLNNLAGARKVNVPTFWLNVDGVDFSYTYIRKNACTSFKRLFKSYSSFDFSVCESDLKAMARFHLLKNKADIQKCSNRIFVYRDPVDRVVSVYKNKFIQRSGATDILKDYYDKTGLDPDECTFEVFIKEYVSLIKKGVAIDAHLLPQVWHLYPLEYSAIQLSEIERDISLLLGESVASKFFSKPVNSSSNVSSYDNDEVHRCASIELNSVFKENSIMPSFESYKRAGFKDFIFDIYEEDYLMIESMY